MKDKMKEWFENQDFNMEELPDGHEQRFLGKLENVCDAVEVDQTTSKQAVQPKIITMRRLLMYSAAAMIAVLIGFAGFQAGQYQSTDLEQVSPALAAQQNVYKKMVEKELAALDKLQSPQTERIIADAKANISMLENDYRKINADFQKNSDNPAVIDAMIQNFKNRIRLLEKTKKQILLQQEQIKTQNDEFI
jgi:hypothetical protein